MSRASDEEGSARPGACRRLEGDAERRTQASKPEANQTAEQPLTVSEFYIE